MQLRPLLLALLTPFASAVAAQTISVAYEPPSQATLLGTTYVDWDSLKPKPSLVGQVRSIFDNPTATLEKLEVHATTLRQGMSSHPLHRHPWEEMILIKDGDVEASINGVKTRAGAGYLIFFASNDPHNLMNVGTRPALYYVINFVTDRVHSVSDRPAHEQAVPGMLPSSVIDCNDMTYTKTDTGFHVAVVDSPTLTFKRLESHITVLNAGQATRPDGVDSGEELFVLLQGTVEVKVDGVSGRFTDGSVFYCAPNSKRSFRNIGTMPAVYHVLKVVSDKSPAPSSG
jgi:XRE family transcriptional regulator, regulator of sulfur utilization